jgi:hypothetical protein
MITDRRPALAGLPQLIPPRSGAKKNRFFRRFGDCGMSVLKNKRGLSSLEFFHNAIKLHTGISEWLMRDFGVRDKVRIEDRPGEESVKIVEQFPGWMIAHYRDKIMNLLDSLMMNITAANTIYPITFDELALRRRYQTGAIINCQQLIIQIQCCQNVFPLELKKFQPYYETLEYEIKLLKGWRKANNKIAEKIKEKPEKE